MQIPRMIGVMLVLGGMVVPIVYARSASEQPPLTYHYDAFSRLSSRVLSNGIATVYHYDAYGGVASLGHYYDRAQHRPIAVFTYVYNQDGSIRKRVRKNGFGQQAIEQYQYDRQHNLKDYLCSGALCPKNEYGQAITYQHYFFDALNNIQTMNSNSGTITYDYDKTNPTRLVHYHRRHLHDGQDVKLIYDHNGNVTQDGQGHVVVYNPLDQAQSIRHASEATHYIYNGMGQQVGEQLTNHQTTYFIYGQAALLNMQTQNQYSRFLYGLDRLGKQDQQSTQYDLADQNHSVAARVIQTPAALNIKRYVYSPYGIETECNPSSQNAKSTQYFGFDGQLTDSQTHWQFLGEGYRAYNPMLRRFMRQDSLSPFDQGGVNGYIFGNNNPIMMRDPSGHMPFWANMGLGFAMGIMAGIFTSEIGGLGAVAINAFAGAIGANFDAIDAAAHGKAIHWKQVGLNTGVGAALGAVGGEWGEVAEGTPVMSRSIQPYVETPFDISSVKSSRELFEKMSEGDALRMRTGDVDYVFIRGRSNVIKTSSKQGVVDTVVAENVFANQNTQFVENVLQAQMYFSQDMRLIGRARLASSEIQRIVAGENMPTVYLKKWVFKGGDKVGVGLPMDSVGHGVFFGGNYGNTKVYAGQFVKRPFDRFSLLWDRYRVV